MKWVGVRLAKLKQNKHILKDQGARMKGESKRELTILTNSEKEIKKIQRSKLGEDKGKY